MSGGVGLGEEADELRKTEAEAPPGGGNSRLWQATGLALVFLDALGGAVFLPILPLLAWELGVRGDSSVAAWVGLLVGTYNAGRSGTLAVARACASTRPANAFVHHTVIVLGLSTAIYLVCGILVGRCGLWWFALFRLLSGMISAVHQTVGTGCLERASRQREDAGSTIVRGKVPSTRESVVTVAGLVVGCVIAGFLFSSGTDRPIARLCLAVVGIHAAPALCVLAICLQSGSLRRAGGWSAVAGFDLARPSFPNRYKKSSVGGSEIEMTIEGQVDDGAHAEHRVACNEPQRVVGPPSPPTPAQEPLRGSTAESHTAPRFPQRYLRGCKEDPVEAQRRWQLTLEWRASERIDEILEEPQPYFEIIKRHYPHYLHRRARNGCPVWIELPTRINLSAIRASGVSDEALRRHYVFVTEYLWGVVEPDFDAGQVVTVLDVQGLGMRDLAGDALGFVKRATSIVQDHYVERSNRMFIINAPSYFSMIWRIVRPMLDERTQSKICIVNADKAKIAAALLEVIASEDLPRQYGGTCEVGLGESKEERGLRCHVARVTPSLSHLADDAGEADPQLGGGQGKGLLSGDEAAGRGSAGGVTANGGSRESQGGDPRVDVGASSPDAKRSGAARRVLGRMAGAVRWAGGKMSRRRSRVAHLGDDNAFVYDETQQRWVLGRGARGRSSDSPPGVGDTGKRNGRRGGRISSRTCHDGSLASNSSEEMTVLAIQAAHFSMNRDSAKPSPVPSSSASGTRGKAAGAPADTSPHGLNESGEADSSGIAHSAGATDGGGLVTPCPWMRPFGRRAAFPALKSVLYATSTAVREAVPVWALARVSSGGLAASPQHLGVAVATGVLLAEAGKTVASTGCLGSRSAGDASAWGGSQEYLLGAVWGRGVLVAVLGVVYLAMRLASDGIPPAILWLAVTSAVAANQVTLGLSRSEILGAPLADRDERASGDVYTSKGAPSALCPSLLVGDVVGSSIGPLLLALGLCSGWWPPFDASLWIVCCPLVDLWCSVRTRQDGDFHTRLVESGERDRGATRSGGLSSEARFTRLM